MYRGFQLVVSGAGAGAATAASAAVGPAFSVAAILVEYDTALDAMLFRNEVDFMIPRGSNNPVHVIRRGILARIYIIRAVAQVQVLRDEMTLSSSTAEPVSQTGPFYYSYVCVCFIVSLPPFSWQPGYYFIQVRAALPYSGKLLTLCSRTTSLGCIIKYLTPQ